MEENRHPLEVRNLHLNFGGVKALNGVSFHVNDGEILSIIGPNGAGKSTFLNIFALLKNLYYA